MRLPVMFQPWPDRAGGTEEVIDYLVFPISYVTFPFCTLAVPAILVLYIIRQVSHVFDRIPSDILEYFCYRFHQGQIWLWSLTWNIGERLARCVGCACLTRVSAGVTFGSIARFQAGSITLQSFLPVVQETLALHSFHILNDRWSQMFSRLALKLTPWATWDARFPRGAWASSRHRYGALWVPRRTTAWDWDETTEHRRALLE